ncbi:MAG: 3-oxoacyl-ACP synthase, partial [Streptococcaceae bacterium]|nr:3-oxoacyl-ACP synthase [Streptococcaceae bacterium]
MSQFAKITQTAHFVPEFIVTNDDLAQMMDTSDEWIKQRTGIEKRHISTKLNTSDLCINVANQLLKKADIQANELDFVIIA